MSLMSDQIDSRHNVNGANGDSINHNKFVLPIAIGLLIFAGLYISRLHSYLLFHCLSEGFSIVVGCSLFMLAWNSRQMLENDYLLFIGIAFLFVAVIDLVHSLAYSGMGVLPHMTVNTATQLWVAARYFESISLLIAPLFFHRKLNCNLAISVLGILATVILISIFTKHFPDCFIEGKGLTAFKIVSEYVISAILIASIILLRRFRRILDSHVYFLMVASMLATVGSEMAFALYTDPYGFTNQIGHFLKIISFYLIYRAVIVTGLRRPYDLFYRQLCQSEKELKRSRNELAIANKDLESFSYSVAHDLRNPLNSMLAMASVLDVHYTDSLDEDGKRCIVEIKKNAVKMNTIITQLLQLSKVAHHSLKNTDVRIDAIAADFLAELRKSAPQREVKVVINENITVHADEGLMRIALENLIRNAWKYSSKREDPFIEIGMKNGAERRHFFVKDNGIGFDMKDAQRIFEPFQRAHPEKEYKGTGIGLSIVKRIIDKHGGRIWAESEIGKGACFYFTLP